MRSRSASGRRPRGRRLFARWRPRPAARPPRCPDGARADRKARSREWWAASDPSAGREWRRSPARRRSGPRWRVRTAPAPPRRRLRTPWPSGAGIRRSPHPPPNPPRCRPAFAPDAGWPGNPPRLPRGCAAVRRPPAAGSSPAPGCSACSTAHWPASPRWPAPSSGSPPRCCGCFPTNRPGRTPRGARRTGCGCPAPGPRRWPSLRLLQRRQRRRTSRGRRSISRALPRERGSRSETAAPGPPAPGRGPHDSSPPRPRWSGSKSPPGPRDRRAIGSSYSSHQWLRMAASFGAARFHPWSAASAVRRRLLERPGARGGRPVVVRCEVASRRQQARPDRQHARCLVELHGAGCSLAAPAATGDLANPNFEIQEFSRSM